jgi:hypothetical protein
VIKGVSVVYLHSAHGEELASWYSEKLGLQIKAAYPGWTEFGMARGSRFAVDHTVSWTNIVIRPEKVSCAVVLW